MEKIIDWAKLWKQSPVILDNILAQKATRQPNEKYTSLWKIYKYMISVKTNNTIFAVQLSTYSYF